MKVIQQELDRARIEWNCHRLRPVRNSVCPSGHPNELFYLPQLLGKVVIIIIIINLFYYSCLYRGPKLPLPS